MSIRTHETCDESGMVRKVWLVDYVDHHGMLRQKLFDSFCPALSFDRAARDSSDRKARPRCTVREAGERWIHRCVAEGLQGPTVRSYETYLNAHILPFFAEMDVAAVSRNDMKAFEIGLHQRGCSAARVYRVTISLCAIIADAAERGHAAPGLAVELRRACRRPRLRPRNPICAGVDIPTPDELRRILQHGSVRERLLIQTAAYAGLTPRELLGLTWRDVDLEQKFIEVRQRVNRDLSFGPLKCPAWRRVPLAARLVCAFREWKLYCPETVAELVFPARNGKGTTLSQANRQFQKAQLEAGVTRDQAAQPAPAANRGAPRCMGGVAKYRLVSLRYFFAAWCATSPRNGGLGLSPSVVKHLLGLSTFETLMRTFGHFFNEDLSPDDLDAFDRSVHHPTDPLQPPSAQVSPSSKGTPDESA